MRKLQLLTALAIGIMSSSTGIIQANAALYTFSVDFETKTVANFNDYQQTYYSTTYDLGASVIWNFAGSYSFASCPAPITVNMIYRSYWLFNGVLPAIDNNNIGLPDFPCTTTITTYAAEVSLPVSDQLVEAVINDDANFATLVNYMIFNQTGSTSGLRLRLHNYTHYITLNYNFDTTYLFNYFLSDTQAEAPIRVGTGTWTVNSEQTTKVDYVYTTAGNDEYRIVNTNIGSVGLTRKKYAVDYNMEYFRGQSIGARIRHAYNTDAPYSYDELLLGSSSSSGFITSWKYYYLNAANNSQAIVDAPEFDFEYEDCGWDVFNIPCFINNGLAYITNDAPIISDAITLLNAGIGLAAQTFGIIGAFTTDNVFGYLILAGFGFIAVRWFLKND